MHGRLYNAIIQASMVYESLQLVSGTSRIRELTVTSLEEGHRGEEEEVKSDDCSD